MDKGADTTSRLIIGFAVVLGILIVFLIGYSLYQKARIAEGQLANKVALDNATKESGNQANVSLTGEAKNSSQFTYDGLVQKAKNDNNASTTNSSTNYQVVNETAPVDVPQETITTPTEEFPNEVPAETPVVTPKPKPIVKATIIVDTDRPLTADEIRAIRQLPVDNSPSGKLQTTLEQTSNGQYKANY